MEKRTADKLITAYLPKLYGFAIKKAFSYAEAEELCADIVAAVYASLRKAEEIVNTEGYIWRISEHTYARFVARNKRHEGVSIDGMAIPFYDEDTRLEAEEDMQLLRREIAFLTAKRRQIVFWFYYENRSIAAIAQALGIPEGTVKWHLNKARHDLKEGLSMKRQIGTLGLSPLTTARFGHYGTPGKNGGPEFYLADKLSLNIVYSVYFEPKNATEIAQELGVSPVFLEDKITVLEENDFLVRQKDGRFTTYVEFQPRTFSREQSDRTLTVQQEIAQIIAKDYVSLVREAFKNDTVYIPSGNRELFEAAMIFWAIIWKCRLPFEKDLSRYYIKTADGGEYIAYVDIDKTCRDPEYVSPVIFPSYSVNGEMNRSSDKYPSVRSKSWDSRLDSREGGWQNNLCTDYEYVYEWMNGMLDDTPANAEKLARLKERKLITEDGKVNIMIVKDSVDAFSERLPEADESLKARFYDIALEQAMLDAKAYPPQMQELIVWENICSFINTTVAMMVLDILYENGMFKPLSEQDKVSANLLMFCDRLP